MSAGEDVHIDGGDRYRLVRADGRLALVVPGGPETAETLHLHLYGADEVALLKEGVPYLERLADSVRADPDAYRARELRPAVHRDRSVQDLQGGRSYTAPMTPRFDVVGVIVADMGKALAFYRRLGLDIPPDADAAPHVEHQLPGGLRLAFDTHDTMRSFDPDFTPPTGGGIALAFACESPAAVDSTYADLVSAGYESHLAPWDAFWGQRYASVKDPDGNGVDLFAALPT